MYSRLYFAGFALLIFLAGCGQPSTQSTAPAKTKPQPDKVTSGDGEKVAPAPAAEVTLRTVDIDGFNAELAKHVGKVVLLDFWATWCVPCTEQFPHTVDLHKKYSGQGLVVVSVSVDGDSDEESALDFLKKNNAAFTNLRSEYGVGTETFEKFAISDGGVPEYRLYDKRGTLREKWKGKPDGIEQKIEDLLKDE